MLSCGMLCRANCCVLCCIVLYCVELRSAVFPWERHLIAHDAVAVCACVLNYGLYIMHTISAGGGRREERPGLWLFVFCAGYSLYSLTTHCVVALGCVSQKGCAVTKRASVWNDGLSLSSDDGR